MSIKAQTFVLWGVVLPYDGDLFEQCEPYNPDADRESAVNRKGNMTVLFDGMSGEYIVVGHVIAHTEDGQAFEEIVTINEPSRTLAIWNDELDAALSDIGAYREPSRCIPCWHVISHYT